ncbi:BolA family protein [Pelomicrobium sp. G1]|jgi:BolA protein|uniref:BolA family protein n=1 Tax=unclassified Pelomicrobium TaxID=2815318 RepID=UPI003F7664D2
MSTEERIRERLKALAPEALEVVDESALHAGHQGAKSGGHYRLTVVSPRFAGQSVMARHRMIYEALRDLMQKEIHALSIRALAPDEF